MRTTLKDRSNDQVKEILGEGHVDDNLIRRLLQRLGVFILTDSFLMNTKLSYKVSSGESLWTILKKLHAGQAPSGFRSVADRIASTNGLESADHIVAGTRISIQWSGINKGVGGADTPGDF